MTETVSVPLPSSRPAFPAAAEEPVPAVPAAGGSPLLALRDRRAKLQEKLYTDMRVPRWGELDDGPALYVRYGPANPSDHAERIEKIQKQTKKPKDWQVKENAQLLVKACIGVYAVEGDAPVDGEPDTRRKLSLRDGDPTGEWTRFDPDLADSLGLEPDCGAVAVVRALYLTEADITSTVNRLLRWSGLVMPSDTEDFSAG